jgi:hypothetical protein
MPATAAPTMTNEKIWITAYWLNGSSAMGIASGGTDAAHRFCSGRRAPLTHHGAKPTAAAAMPIGRKTQAATRGSSDGVAMCAAEDSLGMTSSTLTPRRVSLFGAASLARASNASSDRTTLAA